MKAFPAPSWDVDRPANTLFEHFSEGHKHLRNKKKAKKNRPSGVFGVKNISNKTSQLKVKAAKVEELHKPKKGKKDFLTATKKLNAFVGNSGIQPSLKKKELFTSVNRTVRKEKNKNKSEKRGNENREGKLSPIRSNEKYRTNNSKSRSKEKTKSEDLKHSKVFDTDTSNVSLNLNKRKRKRKRKRVRKTIDQTKDKTKAQVLGTFNDTSSKSSKKSKSKFSSIEKLSSATMGKKNASGKIQNQFDKNEQCFTTSKRVRKRKFLELGSSEENYEQIQKKLKVNENEYSINKYSESHNLKNKLKHSLIKGQKQVFANRKKKEQEEFKSKKTKKDREHKQVEVSHVGVTAKTDIISDKSKQVNQMQKCAKPSKKKRNAEQPFLSLRERMMAQLKSSRFRYLNEQLYISHSEDSKQFFENDPDSFYKYHEGFKQQVEKWPLNPVDKIIKAIKRKPANLVIADFGCGDATLAKSVPNKVHSFDLFALSEEVTVCDIANTPLENATIDVVVFCLSLMGTNLSNYLIEANRVLKDGGVLKIAEVASRFDDVDIFIKKLKKYGFSIAHKDFSHNLFYFMNFTKTSGVEKIKDLPDLNLKPCWYKKR